MTSIINVVKSSLSRITQRVNRPMDEAIEDGPAFEIENDAMFNVPECLLRLYGENDVRLVHRSIISEELPERSERVDQYIRDLGVEPEDLSYLDNGQSTIVFSIKGSEDFVLKLSIAPVINDETPFASISVDQKVFGNGLKVAVVPKFLAKHQVPPQQIEFGKEELIQHLIADGCQVLDGHDRNMMYARVDKPDTVKGFFTRQNGQPSYLPVWIDKTALQQHSGDVTHPKGHDELKDRYWQMHKERGVNGQSLDHARDLIAESRANPDLPSK